MQETPLRLLHSALRELGAGQQEERRRVVRHQLQGGFGKGLGLHVVAVLEVQQGLGVVGRRVVGRHTQHAVEPGLCRIAAPQVDQDARGRQPRQHTVRQQLLGPRIGQQRRVRLP